MGRQAPQAGLSGHPRHCCNKRERWSARLYWSPSYYGRKVQTAYVELDAHVPVAGRGRLFGHLGALVSSDQKVS